MFPYLVSCFRVITFHCRAKIKSVKCDRTDEETTIVYMVRKAFRANVGQTLERGSLRSQKDFPEAP